MNINKYVLYKVYTKKVFLSFKACFPQGENNIEKKLISDQDFLQIYFWYSWLFQINLRYRSFIYLLYGSFA